MKTFLLLALIGCGANQEPDVEVAVEPTVEASSPTPPGYRVASAANLTGEYTNRLSTQTSPYLLQHQHNPVDWYPWGDEAFAEAKARNVPIFLSIGYAACHWCHVMEEESFEDPHLAAYLNAHFVSIKVDREERPDVDAVYMDAIHALRGSGGWPASIWLNHERKPFYAGTYFPKTSRYGRPSFRDVLEMTTDKWTNDRQGIENIADEVNAKLYTQSWLSPTDDVAMDAPLRGLERLNRTWDTTNSGWGNKKFPMIANLEFMLAYGLEHDDAKALGRVRSALDAMDKGGIHDHLGGGFHRYTVDPTWTVPHFEKMTYDNGQFLSIYAEAAVALDEPRYATVARSIADYMLRDMLHGEGAFYSSQDADSGGEEGTYYVWNARMVEAALEPGPAAAFIDAYGITDAGNFEGKRTVLTRRKGPADAPTLAASRETLRVLRNDRIAPPTDTKRVVAYNALMIAGLARAGRLLDEPRFVTAAEDAASAVLAARHDNGSLPRTLEPGAPLAVIDDYALLVEGLLDLYMASHDPRWLTEADSVAATMSERFWDGAVGGFFFSDADAPGLLVRQKDYTDGARPSGAARGTAALTRLRAFGAPSGDGEKVQRSLEAAGLYLQRSPGSVPTLLTLVDGLRRPGMEVIVVHATADKAAAEPLIAAFDAEFRPHAVLGVHSADASLSGFSAFRGKVAGADGPLAYVCFDGVCKQPVGTVAELISSMAERPAQY